MSTLQELEAELQDQDTELEAQRLEQRAKDLPELIAARKKHGVSGVTVLELRYTPGLPTMVIARKPDPNYYKKYQSRLKEKTDEQGIAGVAISAADELADHCVEFPDAATYAAVRKAFPGIHTQVGGAAAGLGNANVKAQGKG